MGKKEQRKIGWKKEGRKELIMEWMEEEEKEGAKEERNK